MILSAGKTKLCRYVEYPDINRGAWIVKSDYPDANLENLVLTEGDQGYIIPASAQESLRTFDNPRVYLSPLPLDQITLYRNNNVELEQNLGGSVKLGISPDESLSYS